LVLGSSTTVGLQSFLMRQTGKALIWDG
jgi:hypothetical protein